MTHQPGCLKHLCNIVSATQSSDALEDPYLLRTAQNRFRMPNWEFRTSQPVCIATRNRTEIVIENWIDAPFGPLH